MITEISIEEYFDTYGDTPLIDVRSPSEFSKGHIPGAHNIPLFSDEERTQIGTVYVKQSQNEGLKLGYDYAVPKSEYYVSSAKNISQDYKVAVHCWRGGMRSRTFAEHLEKNGFKKIFLIKGGYKAFRNFVLSSFEKDSRFIILGGYTGSGKTEILKILGTQGMQVIDLEEIANHKGSAFGGIGKNPQPTYEQFENNLFSEWNKLDRTKSILLEDESIKIGSVQLPNSFYKKMFDAPVIFLDIPKEERAKFLTADYSLDDKAALKLALTKISKRLGDQNTKRALKYLEENNFYEVALTTLSYYDKAYREVLSGRDQRLVFPINLKTVNHEKNSNIIKEFIKLSVEKNISR